MSDRRDVTGVWYGSWSSADADVAPNNFIATLEESGARISGSISEREGSSTEHADVVGTRTGARVAFDKHYDGGGRLGHSVAYAGTINDAGTEIAGSWHLSEGHSGSFTMAREKFDTDELEDEAVAEADVPAAVD